MKYFKMTEALLKATQASIEKVLKDSSSASGATLTITLPVPKKPKAKLILTEIAARKVNALIQMNDKEVAWHGTVTKVKKGVYQIEDILVFPQIVGPASVDTDDNKYNDWMMALPIEQFNSMRFHGHSHVNMGVVPSGVDDNFRKKMCEQLDDFYIFAIFNKSGKIRVDIYDVEENIYYETDDVETVILDTIADWATENIKEQVKPIVHPVNTTAIKSVKGTAAHTINAKDTTNVPYSVDRLRGNAKESWPTREEHIDHGYVHGGYTQY